jgi:hypothetical protein
MSLRRRLDRLEAASAGAAAAGRDDPLLSRVLDLLGELDRPGMTGAEREEVERRLRDAIEERHAWYMEDHPAGRVYRRALDRLGLPQPATLKGIDLIEECVRLAGIPAPALGPAPQAAVDDA